MVGQDWHFFRGDYVLNYYLFAMISRTEIVYVDIVLFRMLGFAFVSNSFHRKSGIFKHDGKSWQTDNGAPANAQNISKLRILIGELPVMYMVMFGYNVQCKYCLLIVQDLTSNSSLSPNNQIIHHLLFVNKENKPKWGHFII